MPAPEVCAAIVALLAAGADVRWRRVPNALTLGSSVAALAYWSVAGGAAGAGWAAAGWLVGLVLFLPLFALGGLGGGDVKLLAALGAWVGPGGVVWVALYGAVAGGMLALVTAWSRGRLSQSLANAGAIVTYWRIAGPRPYPGLTVGTPGALTVPYAVALAAGLVVTLWLR